MRRLSRPPAKAAYRRGQVAQDVPRNDKTENFGLYEESN